MYRMMIVDDQTKEIEGIKRLLDWQQMGIEIVGTAKNGKAGVEEAIRLKPDIIISDIVMRSMDGLEMVNRIKEFLPEIKVVFISCFDDFKFVSQAINNGAYGYVLKPILPGELLTAVNKILNICDKEKKNYELMMQRQKINESISVLRESFYKNLLYGFFENEEDILAQGRFLNIPMEKKFFTVSCIELECNEEERLFFQGVTVIGKLTKQFEGTGSIFPVLVDLIHIAIVFTGDTGTTNRMKKEFIHKTQEILDFIISTCNISATAGIGSVTSDLKGVSVSYREALKALQFKFYQGKMQVIDIEDVSYNFSSFEVNNEDLNEKLKQILFSGERELAKPLVYKLLAAEASPAVLQYTCYTIINAVQMLLLPIQQNLEQVLGSYGQVIEKISRLDNLRDLREWMIQNLIRIIDFIEDKNKLENMDSARKMEEYIRNNFHGLIMLQDVAEYVYLSPSYANFIYKNVYGKTVHQHIEELRLELAVKLLMEEKELKVFKIAEKAGYCNSSYFINVFKKAYGCTPSDYRRKKVND